MSKKVIVLGAGYAGVETALSLHKKVKKSEDIEIYIIDRNPYQTLFTQLHEVAGNRIDPESAKVPLHDIFRYTNVNVVLDEIGNIDFQNNKLVSESNEYPYDYLVIASGGSLNDHGVPGVKENCFSLYSVDAAVKLRDHIRSCFIKASLEKNHEARKSLLTFVIAGGGFSGTELAGELAVWTKQLCKYYKISKDEVKVMIVEASSNIMDELSKPNMEKSVKYLTRKLKVDIVTGSEITEVKPGAVVLKTGRSISAGTIVWTAGACGSKLADKLDIVKVDENRIKIDDFSHTQYDNVYAAGSACLFNSGNYNMPRLIKYAAEAGRTAANNVLSDIRKKGRKKIMQPQLFGLAVSMGSFYAVSNFLGLRLPGFLSVLIKYLINIKYLFHIGGFELAVNYLKEQILNKRQEKFFLEKHYTRTGPLVWVVPIRMYLGVAWLLEGIAKVNEGWFSKAVLAGSLNDGVSGASATETGEKVFRIVAAHTPSWYAWIADNIVVPNAMIFQYAIVLTELILGVALISGTLTFVMGLVALGLNINFLISTGMLQQDWWYLPAAVCMLTGAGKVFGVDHYLLPYLARQWRYFIRNKRIKFWLFD